MDGVGKLGILWVFLSNVLHHLGLAAILLGAVWAADRRGGNGTRQLSVGAQHRVRLSRASRTQFPNTWRELSSWVVLQNVGFALAGALINLITILTEVISIGLYDGQGQLRHLFYLHVWMSL